MKVSILDEIVLVIMTNWFRGCENLTEIENIEKINTSVENKGGMFSNCGTNQTTPIN